MSKKVVGGDYLLDLSSIEIEQSEDGTKTNITDADVLEQLTNLKKYVPNPNGIKPVWVKIKNGENDELVVARGTFANVGTGEFEICVQLNGYKLIISIEFTQALNEDEQPIDDWYIAENDAKYLFTTDYKRFVVEDVKNIDDEILSQLKCGDVVIKHDESGEHAYVVSFKSETGICLTYADASVIETQSYDYVDGTGWVYNSQDLTYIAEPRIENIIDNNLHKRFIEDDIEIETITGVTKTYGKWSLSGSHLLIVLALSLDDTTEIANGTLLTNLNIPQWVLDKIVPIWSTAVIKSDFNAMTDAWTTQTFTVYLAKESSDSLRIRKSGAITLNADRKVRIAFDLLIDNE